MNVNIYSKTFTSHLKKEIEEIILADCEKLNAKDFSNKGSLKIRTQRLFYYIILSIVANFSIGLIYQENNNKENKFYNLVRIISSIFFFVLGVTGLIFPFFPGAPFLLISFLLIYKQMASNKKKEHL